MATNFLDLLKSKNTIKTQEPIKDINQALDTASKFFPNQPQVKQESDKVTGPITVRCERVLDRNRLDLYFSSKPSKETRDLLKTNGFTFDDDRICWRHKDTLINRLFLADNFGLSELLQDSFNDDVKQDNVSPEFAKYRNQVDQLIEHLKIRPADLMLRAIDCLYTQTFKVN